MLKKMENENGNRSDSRAGRKRTGEVYLVGAGPGDKDLVTRKALHCLQSCDAVVYDYLASDQLLEETSADCERIYVGKKAGCHSMKQQEINRILVALAKEGKSVVRLKGGDPMVFGRGGEEVLALVEEGIPFQVVPGVTSVTAALASAGIPVTHRGISRSFHVMTGHIMGEDGELPENFEQFAKLDGTLIFLMGLNNLKLIVEGLKNCGKSSFTPAALIENGSLQSQRVVRGNLEDLPSLAEINGIHSPAIIVVGQVAAFHLESTVERALQGLTFGLTGTEHFVKSVSSLLEAEGADTRYLVRMEAEAVSSNQVFQEALDTAEPYSWLVFTSANGVRIFFEQLWKCGKDHRFLGQVKIAVIGPGTALELERHGFRHDFMPKEYSSASLGSELVHILNKNDRVLIPRAAKGSKELTEIFSQMEISYTDMILYDVGKTISNSSDVCDFLVFGSSSGVDAYFQKEQVKTVDGCVPEEKLSAKIACIGSITANTLLKYGILPDVTAKEFHAEGLVRSILEYVGENKVNHLEE